MARKQGSGHTKGSHQSPQSSSKLPTYLRSQLRLFLTADIVGSTAFKQRSPTWSEQPGSRKGTDVRKKKLHPTWFAPIADFYALTQTSFQRHWDDLKKQAESHAEFKAITIGKAPSFWKAIGDEIAFSKRLNNPVEALFATRAWIKALEETRALLRSHSPELDVKSAAWLAGFPVRNTEVIFSPTSFDKKIIPALDGDDDFVFRALARLKAFYEAPSGDSAKEGSKNETWIRDFVGPSIDTGFRIAGKATPRKFIISVELAKLLHDADTKLPTGTTSLKSDLRDLKLRYDGRESFKGVLGNAPYPLIWIDLDSNNDELKNLNESEDELRGSKSLTIQQVAKFCEHFINRHKQYLMAPYICDHNGVVSYGSQPADHAKKVASLIKIDQWFQEESKKIAAENEVLATPETQITGTNTLKEAQLDVLAINDVHKSQ